MHCVALITGKIASDRERRRCSSHTIQAALIFLAAAFMLAQQVAASEIYRWTDEKGKVHFSDKPSISHASASIELRINTFEGVTYDSSSIDAGKEVIMYSASWCGICKKAGRYFETQGIPYTEYDVEKSAKGRLEYRKLEAKGVPLILVGRQRMNGFSVDGFQKLYR